MAEDGSGSGNRILSGGAFFLVIAAASITPTEARAIASSFVRAVRVNLSRGPDLVLRMLRIRIPPLPI
jgi:hypothetical protein